MEKKLYYYCSAKTFESILKNKEFWLSDVSRSNDYAEISVFFNRVKEKLEERLRCLSTDSAQHKGRYSHVHKSALGQLNQAMMHSYFFAMCFTSLKDNLSQWRAYGDDGRGFCIEIDSEKLERLKSKYCDTEMMKLKPISYSSDDMDIEIDQLISSLDAIINSSDSSKRVVDACREWALTVVNAAAYYKTEGFFVEKETRLCYARVTTIKQMRNVDYGSHLEKIGFRVTNNDCIPYMTFPIGKFRTLISNITIGPRNMASADIVQFMLAKYKFSQKISVSKSNVTYRGK